MTPSRLATATLLLAGLALPALAQGPATTGMAMPVTGSAAASAPGAKVGTTTPITTSSMAATGTSTPAAPVHGAMRSHRRLASASRVDRAGMTHATGGEVAPATTR